MSQLMNPIMNSTSVISYIIASSPPFLQIWNLSKNHIKSNLLINYKTPMST